MMRFFNSKQTFRNINEYEKHNYIHMKTDKIVQIQN